MPFRDGSFGAAYARHVLHLIPDWHGAVGELCRVVRGGPVLIEVGGADGAWRDLWDRMRDVLGPDADHVGLDLSRDGEQALDDAFLSAGAAIGPVAELSYPNGETVASLLDEMERRSPSWTWRVRRRGVAPRERGRDPVGDGSLRHTRRRSGGPCDGALAHLPGRGSQSFREPPNSRLKKLDDRRPDRGETRDRSRRPAWPRLGSGRDRRGGRSCASLGGRWRGGRLGGHRLLQAVRELLGQLLRDLGQQTRETSARRRPTA